MLNMGSQQTCQSDRWGDLQGHLCCPPGSEPSGSAGQMNQVTGLTKAVRIMAPMMSTPAVSTKRVDTAITPKLACSCVCAAGVKSGRGEGGGGGGGHHRLSRNKCWKQATASKQC